MSFKIKGNLAYFSHARVLLLAISHDETYEHVKGTKIEYLTFPGFPTKCQVGNLYMCPLYRIYKYLCHLELLELATNYSCGGQNVQSFLDANMNRKPLHTHKV